jgi:Ca2+-binding EF-hand superfamily protein
MVSENRRPTRHDQHETSGLPTHVLRSVVLRMNDAFPKLYEKWDVKGCMRKNWSLLFERLDTDKSGRLDYEEFKTALIDVLEIPIRSKDSKIPRKDGEIKEEELEGLWAYVDHDKSGEATIDEFQHACYLLV